LNLSIASFASGTFVLLELLDIIKRLLKIYLPLLFELCAACFVLQSYYVMIQQ